MDALTPAELAQKLGVSSRTVTRNRRDLQHLELSKPIGHKRYSGPLVEQFLSGGRVVNFGAGRLRDRRAS